MKKIILAVSVFLICNTALFAKGPKSKFGRMRSQQFTVIGNGKVPCSVDLVEIRFSVSVRDSDSESSRKKHDKIISKVNKYLAEEGYPEEILLMQSSSLERQISTNGKRDDDFYLARSAYLMRTSRVRETNSLLLEFVDIGVDEIQSVAFLSSKQRKLEDEARILALKDAVEKADLMAKTLGLKLGKPVNIYAMPPEIATNSVEVMVKVTFSFKAGKNIKKTVPAEAVAPAETAAPVETQQ